MLYEAVNSVQYSLSELDVRIILTKSKSKDWPRLILSEQRTRNIHYDLNMLPVEDETRKFLEIPKELDDSGSDDDVIDMMYCVCSDVDSEFDEDLPESD